MKSKLKFTGKRTLATIKRACKKHGFAWDESKYKSGSDWVTFAFEEGNEVIYNSCNGKFIVQTKNGIVTEESVEMEKTRWYSALLNFLYIPDAATKKMWYA